MDQPRSFLAIATPVRHVLAPAIAKVRTVTLITVGDFLVLLPVAVWMAGRIVRPINRLAVENMKIQQRRYRDLGRWRVGSSRSRRSRSPCNAWRTRSSGMPRSKRR